MSEKNNPAAAPKFFAKSVDTMQDDLADLISKKNKKNNKPEIKPAGGKNKNIQRELVAVYTDGNGEIPDLTKLDSAQRPVWKTVLYTLIGFLSVVLVAAIAGFFIFSGTQEDKFTNERVSLKIDTPITVVSGQEATYTLIIANNEKINLYNARVEIFYPDDFEYLGANPQPTGDKNNGWDFSVLKVGETQKIEVKGKALAPLDANLTFKAVVNFKPANLNAVFKQEAIVDVKVSSSVLSLDLIGPNKLLANQTAEYEIKYENLSEEDYQDLEVVADYPSGFVFDKSQPEPKEGTSNVWSLAELKAKAQGSIKLKGNYSAAADGGNKEFKARLQIKKNGDFYPQNEETLVTTIVKDQLDLQLIINGSAEDQSANFGDQLVYSLTFKNAGQEELKNVQIIAHLDSEIVDWSSLQDEKNGKISNSTITWTGKNIPKLLKLSPGEEGEINWQIKIKDADEVDGEVSKFSLENYVEAKFQQTGEASGESTVRSQTIVNSINSDLSLGVQARYYSEDNVPLGLGPIQPRVNKTSVYNIRLQLENNMHDIENIRVVATLPKTASWDNKENHTVGDVAFNSTSKKVTWLISRLPKTVGQAQATFNVSITPTEDDLGRVLVLLSEATLTAKDTNTGANISKNIKAITTAFNDPILGQLSGIVE
jgi:uncharacterized repeat protein (TIGR01451 family)